MSSVKSTFTYSEAPNKISLKGESCGTSAYSKICPDDLVANLHKSITKNFNCEDTLCMKPNRFAEFKQLTEEVLNEKYYRVNIDINNRVADVSFLMYLDLPQSSAFSEKLHCTFRQASVKKEMKVTCARTKESCRSLGVCFNSTKETTQYDFTAPGVTDYLKVGAGLASTIFFAYKAYQETRKIFEESKKPVLESKTAAVATEHEKLAPKASPRRALAYTTAAVGSGIFSAYAFQDL